MSSPRFTPEFKAEAVRQVLHRGYSVREVAERVGVSTHALYQWVRDARPKSAEAEELAASKLEIQKLKVALRRAEEERDILKKAAAYFAKDPE